MLIKVNKTKVVKLYHESYYEGKLQTIIINQEKMKSKRVYPPYELFSQGNPPKAISKAISKSLLVSEIPEISRNNKSQAYNAEFDLVDSSSGSTTHFYISSTKLSTQRAW